MGRVRVRRLGLNGDQQADLSVHGGVQKAVYAYPTEHYEYWRCELRRSLAFGMFGENLTTSGLIESSIRIGDLFGVGSAELIVTQPRFPCYKLGIKFGNMDMVQKFVASGRSGFYFAVAVEGDVAAGDSIRLMRRGDGDTIADAFVSEK